MCFVPKLRALFQHLNFQKCPRPSVFNAFDFEMCFAPQRRALFRHLNFKKCSECAVLSIFWLRDVLRAAATCTFSTSQLLKNVPKLRLSWAFWLWNVFGARTTFAFFDIQLLKVLWSWSAFCTFSTSKFALRHYSMQFFISHLARWLRTRRFSEPTFRPSGATNHWEKHCFATSPHFRAPASSFFWLSLLWSSLFFSSLLWSFPPLLFLCPYCRKFDI